MRSPCAFRIKNFKGLSNSVVFAGSGLRYDSVVDEDDDAAMVRYALL